HLCRLPDDGRPTGDHRQRRRGRACSRHRLRPRRLFDRDLRPPDLPRERDDQRLCAAEDPGRQCQGVVRVVTPEGGRRRKTMPFYMYQGGYTAETWANLARNPEDREATVRTAMEANGGRLVGLWFTFGTDDFVAIAEMP